MDIQAANTRHNPSELQCGALQKSCAQRPHFFFQRSFSDSKLQPILRCVGILSFSTATCNLLLLESHITYSLCLNVTVAVGEPPLLLAGSVYSAIWSAIRAARKDYKGSDGCGDVFEFNTPATMDKVKKLCGMDNVEKYLARVNTGNSS